jgi:PEP-CTERM motif
MRRFTGLFLAVLVYCLASPAPVAAEFITLRFTGEVRSASSTDPGIHGLFPLGGPVEITLSYESATAETFGSPSGIGDPTLGSYWSPTFTLDATIAGHHYFSSSFPQFFYVSTDPAQVWFDNSFTEVLSGDVLATSAHTWRPHYLDFRYQWPDATFASDALPTGVPFAPGSGVFELGLETCRSTVECLAVGETPLQARINGTLTSAAAVPEPGTLVLMTGGWVVAGLVRLRRDRRQRRPLR